MVCPVCGNDHLEIVVRWFNPSEIQPTIVTGYGDTLKTRSNPEYRMPDDQVQGACP